MLPLGGMVQAKLPAAVSSQLRRRLMTSKVDLRNGEIRVSDGLPNGDWWDVYLWFDGCEWHAVLHTRVDPDWLKFF